ncbi:hypothetical protein FACS18949_03810 [Clostridia bacterium]|nr:hypothetical protein FACS18949_03810 [Clostridia bacterium]
MKLATKIILSIAGLVVLCVAAWQLWLTVHFRLYDGYKELIREAYTYEEGAEFKPLSGSNPKLADMALAADNGTLQLWIDTQTAAAAVLDLRSGKITHTNPPAADDDENANGVNKSILKSQVVIDYYDANRRKGTFNTFDLSVMMGQVEYEGIKDGLRVVYTIGDTTNPTGIVPVYILEERLDELLQGVEDERRRNSIRIRYQPMSGHMGVLELTEATINSVTTIRQLNTVFAGFGYTQEDFDADTLATGVEGALPISFVVALEYRLEGDSLLASVPADHIKEHGGGKIESVQILRYFDAAGAEDEGYMVVPNGSGSVINFNNGKTYAGDYQQYIYDMDPLLADYATLGNSETARLPYFGIQKANGGVLGIIESGETTAFVTASIAGKLNSYNYVYPTFVLRGAMALAMFGTGGADAALPVVEATHTNVELKVRYAFLTKDYDGYSGMARYAREKLESEGVLTPIAVSGGDIPFYMDIVGGAQARKFFASIAYRGMLSMTTYKQAQEIVGVLRGSGITNQIVNYQGWYNRGYYHDVASKINPDNGMGSVKDLKALAAEVEEQGGRFYSDTIFQNVPFTSAEGHGYNWTLESSRYYGGGFVAAFGPVNPTSLYKTSGFGYSELMYDQLSPKFLTRYVDKFLKAFEKYGLSGVSLRDLGSSLASDRKRTEPINREEARDIVTANLAKITEKYNVMVSGGNYYALDGADDLINVPLAHNALYIVDGEIPFYELIIHGAVNYTGTPINLSDSYDEDEISLRLIEFGASPHFAFTYKDSSEMKYTALNSMYSTTFANWKDTAVRIYGRVNEALTKVSGQAMLKHETVSAGVKAVTYEGGVKIYINYSAADVTVDGVNIPAKSYAVKEGAA